MLALLIASYSTLTYVEALALHADSAAALLESVCHTVCSCQSTDVVFDASMMMNVVSVHVSLFIRSFLLLCCSMSPGIDFPSKSYVGQRAGGRWDLETGGNRQVYVQGLLIYTDRIQIEYRQTVSVPCACC